jgi:hypothetical protein
MKRAFTLTLFCTSRNPAICRTCRSRGPAGEDFRAQMGKRYVPPQDWTCPAGIPWDDEAPAEAKLAGKKPSTVSMLVRGRELWAELHAYRYTTPEAAAQFFKRWRASVPCGDCRRNLAKVLKETPPDFSSGDAFFAFGVALHNAVNRKLGRAEWTVKQAHQEYHSQTPAADSSSDQ